jgi:hypothetical protein
MRHFASRAFWQAYEKLPEQVRALADKSYALLKENPQHPSLQLDGFGRFALVCAIGRSRSRPTAISFGSGSARTRITTR